MKILFISNTYYQILMAMQMRCTIFLNDSVDIWVTDQCGKNHQVPDRLKELHLFDNVFYKETKYMCGKKKHIYEKISDVHHLLWGNSLFEDISENSYDELVYYNPDLATHMVFAMLIKRNAGLICSRYEEGILSYNYHHGSYAKLKLAYFIRSIMNKKNLRDMTTKFYCTTPSIYKGELLVEEIPKISLALNGVGDKFSSLFDVHNMEYRQKYIYFSSVYDIEGENPIGELEIICKIAEKVGKENLLVKVHPRDDVSRFENCGLGIDTNSAVPWEAIQLGRDFSEKVFLTLNSGSTLSVNLCIDKPAQTYYVYPLCNVEVNSRAKQTVQIISQIFEEVGAENSEWLHVLNNIGDL